MVKSLFMCLFINERATAMLTLTTHIDNTGLKAYTLEGDLIDHDGQPFTVGESTFNPDRIESKHLGQCQAHKPP